MSLGRLSGSAAIDAIKTAKEITLYLRQTPPAELLRELKELTSRQNHATIEVVVEDFRDTDCLRALYSAGCSIYYGLGIPSQPLVFLDRTRGFLVEDQQFGRRLSLKPVKNPEDLYLRLLWRRFGNAVSLSGSIKEKDIKSGLFCLVSEGGRELWCRPKDPVSVEVPPVGTKIEIFAWEKWLTHVLEVLQFTLLEAGETVPQ